MSNRLGPNRLAALFLVLLMGGCGAQEGSRDTTPQGAPSTVAKLQPCQLISRAEVEQAIGVKVGEGESTDTADVLGSAVSSLRQCSFYKEGDKWNPMLVLTMMRAPASVEQFEQQLATAQQLAGVQGIRVDGIGDAAIWFQKSGTLRVMTGNVQFVLDDVVNRKNAGAEPGDALRKLSLEIVGRRPVFEPPSDEEDDEGEDDA